MPDFYGGWYLEFEYDEGQIAVLLNDNKHCYFKAWATDEHRTKESAVKNLMDGLDDFIKHHA